MTPEQILQINEQMAKICGLEFFKTDYLRIKVDDGIGGESIIIWQPNSDWNHLIEVYNACLKLRVQLDKNESWINAQATTEELKALAALRSFLLSNEHYYAVIADSYSKLSEFINWYNKLPDEQKLPAPGTQSPDRTIPNTRR